MAIGSRMPEYTMAVLRDIGNEDIGRNSGPVMYGIAWQCLSCMGINVGLAVEDNNDEIYFTLDIERCHTCNREVGGVSESIMAEKAMEMLREREVRRC